MKNETKNSPVFQTILNYRNESIMAKAERMAKNQANWNCYHMKQDFSGKQKGQSTEFLPKQSNSVEELTAFLQQGLIDSDNWFSIENEAGVTGPQIITPEVMKKLLARQLKKARIDENTVDSLKMGFLGSLMITKIGGKVSECLSNIKVKTNKKGQPMPEMEYRSYWNLNLSIVRHEDYHPDPTGSGLYEVEDIEVDYYELLEMAKQNPDIFDMEAVKNVKATGQWDQSYKKSQETGQNMSNGLYRKRVVIHECWGNILDPTTGEILHKNVQCAVTADGQVIIPPRKNTFWHGESPYVTCPIIRVPKSVWHKALMDGATSLNLGINEIFNLILDGGLMSVFGIRQIREDWLEDPSQIEDGIPPATTLRIKSIAPQGTKAMERVDTGTGLNEGIAAYNLVDREYVQSTLSSALRQGALPNRQVKATEIIASTQATNSIFNGIVKIIEENYTNRVLIKSWKTCAQHMNDMDHPEVVALLGAELAGRIAKMSKAEIFSETGMGKKFKVFGLSMTLNKIQDFRKITQLLQTVSNVPALSTAFAKKYSFSAMLGEILSALEIDVDKIKASPEEIAQAEYMEQMGNEIARRQATGEDQATGGSPDVQSQIPQAMNGGPELGVQVPRRSMLQGITNPG